MRPTVQGISSGAFRHATSFIVEGRQCVRRSLASSSRVGMASTVTSTTKLTQHALNARSITTSAAARAASPSELEPEAESPTASSSSAYPFAPNAVIRQRPAKNELAHGISYVKKKEGLLRKRVARKGILAVVNGELRAQYDEDGTRKALITRKSKDVLLPGSIVNVETWHTMAKTTFSAFAGVVLAIRRRGTSTSIVVRNLVNKTGVEVRYNIYSPMIKQIHVVKRAVANKAQSGLRRARRAKLYYLRQDDKRLPNVGRAIQEERSRIEREEAEQARRNETQAKEVLQAAGKA